MNSKVQFIAFATSVEEVAAKYPKAVSFLTGRNVRCIRCGEPLWCSMGELFAQDGVNDPQQLLDDLNKHIEDSQQRNISITGHRGASGVAPENTISAFKQAISDGADFVETDVQPTKDGKLVLFHDDTLERTTNTSGLLTGRTWSELKELDAGSWFDSRFNHEKIPLLSQAIDLLKNKVRLNIEIKISRLHKDFLNSLVELIHKKEIQNICILTSFHEPSIEYIHSLATGVKTGIILDKTNDSIDEIIDFPYEVLSLHDELVTDALVGKAHEKSKEVHVWTVNEEKTMRKMIEHGVDNIITNYPGILKSILEQNR